MVGSTPVLSGDQALQDLIPGNHCFGCGPANQGGLQLKSYWSAPGETRSSFQPAREHSAGPEHILNGGIIATLIDCHSICTAIANYYSLGNQTVGSDPQIWCVTGSIEIRYMEPARIDQPAELLARVIDAGKRKTIVNCSLSSAGKNCANAVVIAIRVPPEWRASADSA